MESIASLIASEYPRKAPGTFSFMCPECSDDRTQKNRSHKCLRITFEENQAVWFCHNCGVKGQKFFEALCLNRFENSKNTVEKIREKYMRTVPLYSVATEDFRNAIFLKRGIDPGPVGLPITDNILHSKDIYFNRLGGKSEAVGFAYGDGAIKWRAVDSKDFSQTGVCRSLFPAPSSLSGLVLIVEGEYDAISMRSCGYEAYSVPTGASVSGDVMPDFLRPLAEGLDSGTIEVVVAVDADEKGRQLSSVLAGWLGRRRVGVIDWSRYGVKDANEALSTHGKEIMRVAIAEIGDVMYEGIVKVSDISKAIKDIRIDGFKGGAKIGLNSIDNLYTVCADQVTVVTGVPGSGKSELIDYFMVSLAQREDWKFAIFSAENPIEIHVGKLLEKYSGSPIFEGDSKIGEDELGTASEWLGEHFFFLDPSSSHTIDSILARTEILVVNHQVNGLLIDPFNYTDVTLETDAISSMLTKLHLFAKKFHIHIWIVAHPQKMYRGEGGKIPVPTGGDISGSAAWWAKSDFGITVSRNDDNETRMNVWKCRFKWLGEVGSAALEYDRTCGRYSDGQSSGDIADSLADIDWGDIADEGKEKEKEKKQIKVPAVFEDFF